MNGCVTYEVLNTSCTVAITEGTAIVDKGTDNHTSIFRPFKLNELAQQPSWLLTILVLIIILTVVGNTAILLVFVCVKRLRTPFNYYIFNLAITDLLVGTIAMPGFTVYNMSNGQWPAGRIFCSVWMYFGWHMTFESTITLASLCVDRYWSIRWPVSYKMHHSSRITIFILLTTWVYMHLIFFPFYLYDRVVNHYEDLDCLWDLVLNKRFSIPVAVLGYYAPLGVIIYCNVRIFQLMARRFKVLQQSGNAAKTIPIMESERLSKRKYAKERKPLITLTFITIAAVICWAPWVVYFTVAPHYPTALPDILVTIGYWMCYLNSTINPYLYIVTSAEFRQASRLLFSCSRDRNVAVTGSKIDQPTLSNYR